VADVGVAQLHGELDVLHKQSQQLVIASVLGQQGLYGNHAVRKHASGDGTQFAADYMLSTVCGELQP
jgi:hypothetical protein